MSNAEFSSASPEWGTSDSYISIAREVLGEISVDPFSSEYFNRHVGAARFGSIGGPMNGFLYRWPRFDDAPSAYSILKEYNAWQIKPPVEQRDEVFFANETAFVNPPGDKRGRGVRNAWIVLETYHRLGWFPGGAIWVGFSLNQLQTLQGRSRRGPLDGCFRRLVPARRQPFRAVDRADAVSPPRPSFLLLMPAQDPDKAAAQVVRFNQLGCQLGKTF